jgi:hypothetical protein
MLALPFIIPIDPGFPFCLPAATEYTPICLHRRSFCIRCHPKEPGVPSTVFAGTKKP